MIETSVKVNTFLIGYSDMLLADIAEERFAEQPMPGINHPAWIVGHLIHTADAGAKMLGAAKELPEEWGGLFGGGSKLSSDRSVYPSKEELQSRLRHSYARLRELACSASPEVLTAPNPSPRLKGAMPFVGDAIGFLLSGHFGVHLGQLSSWRRMTGVPPLF